MYFLRYFSRYLVFLSLLGWGISLNAQTLGVDVSGVSEISKIECKNKSTKQKISIRKPDAVMFDCEAEGLIVNTGDKVKISIEAIAQGMIPDAPTMSSPIASGGLLLLSWSNVVGADAYNVYAATSPGVTTDPVNLISTNSNNLYLSNTMAAGTYYFIATATNSYGESRKSTEVSANIDPNAGNTMDHSLLRGQPCVLCHNATFATGKTGNHPATSNVCEACHNTNNWLQLISPFSHNDSFGLCSNCHGGSGIATGKPGGHCTTTDDCSVCHNSTINWTNTIADCLPLTPLPPTPTPTPNPPPSGGGPIGSGGNTGGGGSNTGGGGTGGGGGGNTGGGGGGGTGGGGGQMGGGGGL